MTQGVEQIRKDAAEYAAASKTQSVERIRKDAAEYAAECGASEALIQAINLCKDEDELLRTARQAHGPGWERVAGYIVGQVDALFRERRKARL